jgi:predicted XRE-type DNA-binding protein
MVSTSQAHQDLPSADPHRRSPAEIAPAAQEPESFRVRLLLMARLRQMMKSRHLTQVQAARWFRVSQSRVSHLVNDRVTRFTADALVNMLAHAGVHVQLAFMGDAAETRW